MNGHNHGGHSHGGHARMIDNFFAEILRGVSAGRIVWDPVNGTSTDSTTTITSTPVTRSGGWLEASSFSGW